MINELLSYSNGSMTNFQLDNFVTGMAGGSTDWGRFKQASQELRTRLQNLKGLVCDWMEIKEKIIRLRAKKPSSKNNIKIMKEEWKLESLTKNATTSLNEANRFYQHLCCLKRRMPTLNDDTIAKLEDGYWIDRALGFAVMDIMVNGRLDKGTCEMIRALPQRLAAQVLQAITKENFETTRNQFLMARPEPLHIREDDSITLPMFLEFVGGNKLFDAAATELISREYPSQITSC
jgi:hypothetical protein